MKVVTLISSLLASNLFYTSEGLVTSSQKGRFSLWILWNRKGVRFYIFEMFPRFKDTKGVKSKRRVKVGIVVYGMSQKCWQESLKPKLSELSTKKPLVLLYILFSLVQGLRVWLWLLKSVIKKIGSHCAMLPKSEFYTFHLILRKS